MFNVDLMNLSQSVSKIEKPAPENKAKADNSDQSKRFDDILSSKTREINKSKEYKKNDKNVNTEDGSDEALEKDEPKKTKKEITNDIIVLLNISANDSKVELKAEMENLGFKSLDEATSGEVTLEDINAAINELLTDKLTSLNNSFKAEGIAGKEDIQKILSELLNSSDENALLPETLGKIENILSKNLSLEESSKEIVLIISKEVNLDNSEALTLEETVKNLIADKNKPLDENLNIIDVELNKLTDSIKNKDNLSINPEKVEEISQLITNTLGEEVKGEDVKKLINKISQKPEVLSKFEEKLDKGLLKEISLKITVDAPKEHMVKEKDSFETLVQPRTISTLKLNNTFSNSKASDEDLFLKEFISESNKEPLAVPTVSSAQPKLTFEDVIKANTEMVISKETVVQDIEKAIKVISDNSIKELAIKVNPRELGQVIIKVIVDGNTMKAEISAENKEAYSMLQSKIAELTEALSPHKISEVNINIFSESNTFDNKRENNNSQNENNGKSSNGVFEPEDGFEEITTVKEDNSTVEMYV